MGSRGEQQLEQLAHLIATSAHSLVSARDREPMRLLELHLKEAAAVGRLLQPLQGQRWLDLGTGGGIPGLVLALEYPRVEWVLVDSVQKKAQAVRGFAATLGLGNVTVLDGRAEALARRDTLRGAFDGVVARAVARMVVLVELARGFTRDGGLLAAVKGSGWEAEVAEARWAMQELGWRDVRDERVASAVRPTWLVTMRAAGPVPREFPRGVGVPQRRPLTGTLNDKPQRGDP